MSLKILENRMGRLHEAAAAGDIDKINRYIAAGDDINDMSQVLNSEGKTPIPGSGDWGKNVTPLHLAAYNGHVDAIRALAKSGANLEQRDAWQGHPGNTAFELAIQNKHIPCARALKENGAQDPYHILDSIFKNMDVSNWLIHAVIYKNPSIIMELHEQGLISAKDAEKTLRMAAEHNAITVAEALINHCKASPNAYNNNIPMVYGSALAEHKTPLGIAAEFGKYKVAKVLLEAGALVDKNTHTALQQTDCTPLRFAMIHKKKKSNYQLIKLLLEYGADIKKVDDIGMKLFLEKGSADEMELLLQYGLDANMIFDGKPLLDNCINNPTMAITLINKGADVTYIDNNGSNYLHKSNNLDLTILLVSSGVSFTLANNEAEKPIECVDEASAVYLAEQGASLQSVSLSDYRALKSTQLFPKIHAANKQNSNKLNSEGKTILHDLVRGAIIEGYLENLSWTLKNAPNIDVNAAGTQGGWTALHEGFAKNQGYILSDAESDKRHVAESRYTQAIDLLIAAGAKPLKDANGRTPLMCMTFNEFSRTYNWQVIDRYYRFEAAFYGVDPEIYKSELIKLRSSGFRSVTRLFDTVSEPRASAIASFWNSIGVTNKEPKLNNESSVFQY